MLKFGDLRYQARLEKQIHAMPATFRTVKWKKLVDLKIKE